MQIALIQPKNGYDCSRNNRFLPQMGLFYIAEYVEQKLQDISVQVYDARNKELNVEDITKSDIVGLTLSWSDYSEAMIVAQEIKRINQEVKIVVGGPMTQHIAPRILKNRKYVDMAIVGDGEEPFLQIVQGKPFNKIPGLVYRNGTDIKTNPPDFNLDINEIPRISLERLVGKKYHWQKFEGSIHNYFPIARNKGCFRKHRCDLCSISGKNQRFSTPEKYWSEIAYLRQEFGIDHFFDTADVFPTQLLDRYLQSKPQGLTDVHFRCYLHPEVASEKVVKKMKKMGFKNVFMGVENYRYFADGTATLHGRYSKGYTTDALIREIKLFGEYGITVTPSIVLGIPGETGASLEQNIKLTKKLGLLNNVEEMEVNHLKVFPGSQLFEEAVKNPEVISRYGDDLLTDDAIDYNRLSAIFVDVYNTVGSKEILDTIKSLCRELKSDVTLFSFDNLKDA